MKTTKLCAILIIAVAFVFCGCKQSPYDKAISYIDDLNTEVLAATNEAEYDAVYNKIVTLNSSEVMTNLNGLSQEQRKEVVIKVTDLTLDALAVKAILYVMPKDVKPTSDDIAKLANECIQKKLDVMVTPYTDVRELVHGYYNIDE